MTKQCDRPHSSVAYRTPSELARTLSSSAMTAEKNAAGHLNLQGTARPLTRSSESLQTIPTLISGSTVLVEQVNHHCLRVVGYDLFWPFNKDSVAQGFTNPIPSFLGTHIRRCVDNGSAR